MPKAPKVPKVSPLQLGFEAITATQPTAPATARDRRRHAWVAVIFALFGPHTTATEIKGDIAIFYDTVGAHWCVGYVPGHEILARPGAREIARAAAEFVIDLLANQDPALPPALADVRAVTVAQVARLEAAHAATRPALVPDGATAAATAGAGAAAPATEAAGTGAAGAAATVAADDASPAAPTDWPGTGSGAIGPLFSLGTAGEEPRPTSADAPPTPEAVGDTPSASVPSAAIAAAPRPSAAEPAAPMGTSTSDRPAETAAVPREAAPPVPPVSPVPLAPTTAIKAIAEVAAPGGTNYRLVGDRPLAPGWHARARDNVAAIRLVKALEEADRPATRAEQDVLIRYVGWGASELAQRVFPTRHAAADAAWEPVRLELQELLSREEYVAARNSTQYAHYTPEVIARCLWRAIVRLGFRGGRVLEPGVGTGLFLCTVPDELRDATRFTGIEKDTLTARIARLLYPGADIRCEDFAATELPANVDLAIGNPPFSDLVVRGDPAYRATRFRLHDFFFAKALDRLKPGGLLAFLTSRGTLDKEGDAARAYLAARADLVGAIRLPRGALAATAGTEVVADIVVLRRRAPGEEPAGPAWVELVTLPGPETPIRVNEYVAAHPEMVLGTHRIASSRFGPAYTVDPLPDRDLGTALAAALDRLPDGIAGVRDRAAAIPGPHTPEASGAAGRGGAPAAMVVESDTARAREGSYLLGRDGALLQVVGGAPVLVALKTGGTGAGMYPAHARIVRRLIPIRDAVREILRLQVAGQDVAAAQARLRSAYDAFVSLYGPINKIVRGGGEAQAGGDGDEATRGIPRTPNLTPYLDDPDAYLVASIEEYNEETGVATKGPIFTARVIAPPVEPAIASSFDALHVVLNRLGRVDIPAVAALLGWEEQAVINDLGDTIYLNPATEQWETSDAYLSGPVRTKLALARTTARTDPRYARNVAALERVQPADLNPSDITVRLGAPWIPTDVVEAFVSEVLGSPSTIGHVPAMGLWSVEGTNLPYTAQGRSEWGTERRNAAQLLDDALNARLPQIYDTVDDGHGGETRVLNTEATEAAREKLGKLRHAFGQWIWSDADRAVRLVRLYNDQYNNLVPRTFDGAHLTLPGASAAVTLYPHQKRAIWRIIATGATYLAHAVGAGKAQPLDAKVLTPTGWRRMGELRVGDRVIAGDGTATRVVGVFPQGEKEIYRVTFSDGSSTECCDEHLWLTQTYAERTAAKKENKLGRDWPSAKPKVRALADIRRSLRDPRLGTKNHSIPMVGAVAFAAQRVPLDPYLLGVLLGDGSLSQRAIMVTTADPEIVAHVAPLIPVGVEIVPIMTEGKCPTYRLSRRSGLYRNPVRTVLDNLGLGGVTSDTKFIPEVYLFNTIEVRHAVLQGLLDTDGACSHRGGSVYFYTVSPKLADGVTHLVQSLGGTVRRGVKHPRYTHKGEARHGKPCYVLCISLPPDIQPFRLSRKASLVRPKTSYKPTRYIVSVEPVGKKEAQCIAVAHPSHLYVTDDFIVTHNTLSCIAGIMEQKRLGLSSKAMVVVPNHCLKQWAREFMLLYPNARILVADEVQFHRRRRQRFLARAATGTWDAIIMTHSSFKFIPAPPGFEERLTEDTILDMEALLDGAGERITRKEIEREIERMKERLAGLRARKDDLVDIAEIGVTQLVVDEAQEFRKLSFPSRMGAIKGIDPVGSQRAWDLWVKSRYVEQVNPGRALVAASGTPITNTMGEMFTVQRFMQEDALRARNLHMFDSWAALFGETRAELELQPNGKYKSVTRFAQFVNLPELIQLFRSFADVLVPSDLREVVQLPRIAGGRRQLVRCPASAAFKAYQGELDRRIAAIEARSGPPAKGDDILLAVITDGRHAAIDMRLVDPDAGNDAENKVNSCIATVLRIYRETAGRVYRRPDGTPFRRPGAAQMIFSDLGTPAAADATKRGFSVYHWIRGELIRLGVPPREIAFMQDYKGSEQKVKLFAAVNAGEVRVLIGSTGTMGTGVNAQLRLIALHHLDVPWLPADIEQREGRIVRQGNQNEEVQLYAYATQGSLDATMWQTNQRKASFIEAAMRGDTSIRRVEDLGESQASQFALAKALSSGDERLLTKAGLEGEIARLRRLRAAHIDDQVNIRREIAAAESTILFTQTRIAAITEDLARLEPTRGDHFRMEVQGTTYRERKAAGAALRAALGGVMHLTTPVRLGRIGGFDVTSAPVRSFFDGVVPTTCLALKRTRFDQEIEATGELSDLGLIARLEHALGALEGNLAHHELQLRSLERRLEGYRARLGQDFEFEEELLAKEAELTALDRELAATSTTSAPSPALPAEAEDAAA